jgi:DNA processing protein
MTDHARRQRAALLALLRSKRAGQSWSEIAEDLALSRDALATLESLSNDGALIPDPKIDDLMAAAESELEAWESQGLNLVTVVDPSFPKRLLEIRETPPLLFFSGTLDDPDPGMSVVGSRAATPDGLATAARAASILVERGLSVISGLAEGIDTAAHTAALRAGGRTVAFIGTGIRQCYPTANRPLQDEIAAKGLVASQFLPDAPPTQATFPMRNAVMSGYGHATIVIEAGEKSGTRIQARLAVAHGRPVILMSRVVERTNWGRALADRPGVFIADDAGALERTIDNVMASQAMLGGALEAALGDAVGDLVPA